MLPADDVPLDLADIQAHVLVGFPMAHQAILVATLPEAGRARAWLREVAPAATSTATMRARRLDRATAIAFSHSGLRSLGVAADDLAAFPDEFRAGMRARAALLGDFTEPDDARDAWVAAYRREAVDVALIVAATDATTLDEMLARHAELMTRHGVRLIHTERGEVFSEPLREHFGFRDGISQPAIVGYTLRPEPGQDLVQPGEFVIGYPREQGAGGDRGRGVLARSGPVWTHNGSYLVYRRLRQDVVGFRSLTERIAREQASDADDPLDGDAVAARLVGRTPDGTPLVETGDGINDFELHAVDPQGAQMPLAAHIRKVYPRDSPTTTGGEPDTQTHRVLRRGIPFGTPLPADAGADHPDARPAFPDDRGLLFLCYQTSIARQFEFVQRRWSNRTSFPVDGTGHDPIIGQAPGERWCVLGAAGSSRVALGERVVIPTGGEYLFTPSLTALRALADPRTA